MRDEVKVKRKIVCLIALLVLAALAAGCLAACDTDDELPSGTPVSWETLGSHPRFWGGFPFPDILICEGS